MFWKTRKNEVPAESGTPKPPAPAPAPAPKPNRLEVSLDDPADVTRALQVLGRIVGRKGGRPRKPKSPPGNAAAAAATAPPPAPPAPAGPPQT